MCTRAFTGWLILNNIVLTKLPFFIQSLTLKSGSQPGAYEGICLEGGAQVKVPLVNIVPPLLKTLLLIFNFF